MALFSSVSEAAVTTSVASAFWRLNSPNDYPVHLAATRLLHIQRWLKKIGTTPITRKAQNTCQGYLTFIFLLHCPTDMAPFLVTRQDERQNTTCWSITEILSLFPSCQCDTIYLHLLDSQDKVKLLSTERSEILSLDLTAF